VRFTVVGVREDDGEFFPAVASHEIFQAQAAAEPPTGFAQDGVSSLVPPGVVDALEMIEVDEQHRAGGLRPPTTREFFLDPAHDRPVVR